MQSQADSHDIGVILTEAEGRCVFRKALEGHFEEVDIKLPVNVMEFIVTPAIGRIRIHLFQVVFVKGAVPVDAFPKDKKLSVFGRNKRMSAERAA